jgi:hypothetical protein
MTVAELIEILEDQDGDTEVRLAMQPNWPFEYSIETAIGPDELANPDDDEAADEVPNVIYLTEGSQLGYLPGVVSKGLGWR